MKYTSVAVDVSRDEIIERDGQACYLCGEELSIHEVTFDHVVPLSRGGTHTPENVRIAHHSCNSKKGSRRIEGLDLSRW
jgi:5-methylcytosine-specific restriction endonuclease McrA